MTPETTEPRTLYQWREQLLETLLRGMLVVGLFALVGGGIIPAIQLQRPDLLVTYLAAYAALVLVTFVRKLGFPLRAAVLLVLLYALGALDFSVAGLSGDGRVLLFAFVVVTTTLLNLSRGIVALTLSLLTMAAAAWFLITGRWEIPIEVQANSTSTVDWISGSVVFLLVNAGVIIPIAHLIRSLSHSLNISQEAVEKLEEQRGQLEELVRTRTYDLEHRSTQLQAAAEVARDATATRNLDKLLNRAVNLIRQRFGFYHAGIFLVDEPGEYAVLRAATGEAGRQMLEQGHRLEVGEVGIVGYVTGRGEPRIALDVGADATHFENPLLPETRSEMGLPLRLGERVIGALDVQSRDEAAFDEGDVAVLQTMADQLAVAIENARLLHEMEQTVRELEAAYGRHTRESWYPVSHTAGRPYGYRYRRIGVEPAIEPPAEARQAWTRGHTVTKTIQSSADSDGRQGIDAVAVPIKIRGQVIGVFDVRSAAETIPPEAISLAEKVADRLALALENARLLQETQRRAEREQLLSQMTARFTRSLDLDAVLQAAVRELGSLPNVAEVSVHMAPSQPPSQTSVDQAEAHFVQAQGQTPSEVERPMTANPNTAEAETQASSELGGNERAPIE